jgi:hypothetical protein
MTKRSPDPRLQPLRLAVAGLGLILLASLAFVLLRPSAEPPSTEEVLQPNSPETILRVNLPDAKQAYDSGSAVFLDVRDESSFKSEHIPGALSIPLNDLPARESELDPNAWIIPYCT